MKSDGGGDEHPQPLFAGKGHADADPFGKGMRGHDPEDQQRLGRIRAVQLGDVEILRLRQKAVGRHDRAKSGQHPDQRQRGVECHTLGDQRVTGRKHQPGGGGIRPANGARPQRLDHGEGQRAHAGHDRRHHRRRDDDPKARVQVKLPSWLRAHVALKGCRPRGCDPEAPMRRVSRRAAPEADCRDPISSRTP